jgi:hypothetical protein
MVYFTVLFQNLPGGTAKKHGRPQLDYASPDKNFKQKRKENNYTESPNNFTNPFILQGKVIDFA